jgi:hypothetical protein
MKILNKLRKFFAPRRPSIDTITEMTGRQIETSSGAQLVESVDCRKTKNGYVVTVYTIKGDWSNDIYR